MLIIDLFMLMAIPFVLFLLAAGASTFEVLFWWAGWSRRSRLELLSEPEAPSGVPATPDVDSFIVYLSGAGTMDPLRMEEKEVQFLDLLRSHLPRSVIITDVFPYSATNNPLTGDRRLARLWAFVWRARHTRQRSFFQWLGVHAGQLRNSLQVGVSADRRYGPLHSFGVAQVIASSLMRHGYRPGSDQAVILMALSGSGQVSVGCVPVLKRILQRPVWLLSIGSVLTDDPGILEVEHVHHLSGSLDRTQHLGKAFFPGLWRIFAHSAMNRARAQGKFTIVDVGPMKHMGLGDYLSRSVRLADGQRHVDKTVALLTDFVARVVTQARVGASSIESVPIEAWVSTPRVGGAIWKLKHRAEEARP